MKKKAYMYPTMLVVALKQSRMLCASGPLGRSVKDVDCDGGFGWSKDGFGDDDYDM